MLFEIGLYIENYTAGVESSIFFFLFKNKHLPSFLLLNFTLQMSTVVPWKQKLSMKNDIRIFFDN